MTVFAGATSAREPVNQVHFGADGPDGSRLALAHAPDDVLGGAAFVGRLDHVAGHFGMHDHADARMLLADERDLLRGEARVHGAMPLPQHHPRALQLSASSDRRTARPDPRRPSRSSGTPILYAVLRPRC